MTKVISLTLVVSIFLAGCAGRDPNPIALSMPGDKDLSCEALSAEMTNLKMDMQQLKPKTDKFWTNTFWLIVLPFLMDVKEAEKIEYNAFQNRYNRLLIISQEKGCDFASSLSPLKSAE